MFFDVRILHKHSLVHQSSRLVQYEFVCDAFFYQPNIQVRTCMYIHTLYIVVYTGNQNMQ